jgi:uncharacterized membrane protein YkoI
MNTEIAAEIMERLMKTLKPALILFLMAVALACPAQQAKLKRELSHLPVPVRKTVRAHLGTAKLESIEKNTDDGEVTYDVEMVRDGKERGFTVADNGKLVDEEVFLAELPPVVQRAIQKQAGAATINEIDKSNDNGETSYDVEITAGVNTRGFTVNASGQLMDSEVILAELPPVLQTAIRKQAGADTIGEIDKSFDDGEVSFDVEVTAGSKSRTLTFDPDGELDSVEEKVDFSDTPEVVQKQIDSLAAGGHPDDIRKITEDNEISYDVQVITGVTDKIISIGVDGKILPDDDNK